jgi:polyhydroxyalkanoate synthesis regulator phasin
MFVGGFGLGDIFAPISQKVIKLKNDAVKKGFMSEDLWRNIADELTES